MRIRPLILPVMLLAGVVAVGQDMVQGCVVDRTNKEALPFGKVSIQGVADSAITDVHGCFQLHLPSELGKQRYKLVVAYSGFERYSSPLRRKDLRQGRVHRLTRIPIGPDPPVIKFKD